MTPTLDIIHYLIEQYFDNNGGLEDYEWKEVMPLRVGNRFIFYWLCGFDEKGRKHFGEEHFDYNDGEKITNLEHYVNEVIERILKVPYFDDRPKHGDPRYGC